MPEKDTIRRLQEFCLSGVTTPIACAIALGMTETEFMSVFGRVVEPTPTQLQALESLASAYMNAVRGVNANFLANRVSSLPDSASKCPECGTDLIPGIESCVQCGARSMGEIRISMGGREQPAVSPEDVERYKRENNATQKLMRSLTEARALEYAGDPESAIPIYESLIANGTYVTVPYQRLAIIYNKAKRSEDEERVVRSAIANLASNSESWFVLRLAKIMGKKKK